jgi:hypothetical protein
MRKLAYPLPATCFTRQDCEEILRPLRSCLSSLEINRNHPAVLLHAPRSQLGLDAPDLYVSQGIDLLICRSPQFSQTSVTLNLLTLGPSLPIQSSIGEEDSDASHQGVESVASCSRERGNVGKDGTVQGFQGERKRSHGGVQGGQEGELLNASEKASCQSEWWVLRAARLREREASKEKVLREKRLPRSRAGEA